MQTIQPTGNNIFAEPDKAETKTSSGFLLSEKTVEKPKTANVINVGPDVKSLAANEKIVYKAYTSSEIKLNDTDYIILAEEDVLGKVFETEN